MEKGNVPFLCSSADQRARAWVEVAFSWSLCPHLALCNTPVNIRIQLRQSFKIFMRKPDQRDVLECIHYTNVMDFLMHISTRHSYWLESAQITMRIVPPLLSTTRTAEYSQSWKRNSLTKQPACHLSLISNFILGTSVRQTMWKGLTTIMMHQNKNK